MSTQDYRKQSLLYSLLKLHSSEELNSIRTTLFVEANTLNLIFPELQGLPLVSRRDTALRPASSVLSEDIWCIMNCISNNVTVPRILIKNGKKSKTFLKNAPRHTKDTFISLLQSSQPPINSTSLQIKDIPVCLQTQHAPDPPRPHNQTNNDSSQPALPGSQPPINSTSLQIKNISVCLQT